MDRRRALSRQPSTQRPQAVAVAGARRATHEYRDAALLLVLLLVLLGMVVTEMRTERTQRSEWLQWMPTMGKFGADGEGTTDEVSVPKELKDLKYSKGGRAVLGDYDVKVFDPIANSTQMASFHLTGTMVDDDAEEFWSFMKRNRQSFREQVNITVRNSEAEELIDPQLRILRKRLVARVNRSAGKPFLKSVDLEGFAMSRSVDAYKFEGQKQEIPSERYVPGWVDEFDPSN